MPKPFQEGEGEKETDWEAEEAKVERFAPLHLLHHGFEPLGWAWSDAVSNCS